MCSCLEEQQRAAEDCIPASLTPVSSREDVIYDRELGLRLPESVQFPQKRTQEPRWSPTIHCHTQTHTVSGPSSVKRALPFYLLPFSLACAKFPGSNEIPQKSASLLPRSLTVASKPHPQWREGLSCLPLQLNSCHRHYQERNFACSNTQMR